MATYRLSTIIFPGANVGTNPRITCAHSGLQNTKNGTITAANASTLADGASPTTNAPDPGFTPVARNATFSAYARC